jgi:hypothetical protein
MLAHSVCPASRQCFYVSTFNRRYRRRRGRGRVLYSDHIHSRDCFAVGLKQYNLGAEYGLGQPSEHLNWTTSILYTRSLTHTATHSYSHSLPTAHRLEAEALRFIFSGISSCSIR